MELSLKAIDQDNLACTLLHELAHRLVIGNGIDPPEGNAFIDARANYYMHRHIDLFLYDVFVDIVGKQAAKNEVYRESINPKSIYTKAWRWALSKDYKQRHKSFELIRRRYINSLGSLKI
jgi:hypothetical protein